MWWAKLKSSNFAINWKIQHFLSYLTDYSIVWSFSIRKNFCPELYHSVHEICYHCSNVRCQYLSGVHFWNPNASLSRQKWFSQGCLCFEYISGVLNQKCPFLSCFNLTALLDCSWGSSISRYCYVEW